MEGGGLEKSVLCESFAPLLCSRSCPASRFRGILLRLLFGFFGCLSRGKGRGKRAQHKVVLAGEEVLGTLESLF